MVTGLARLTLGRLVVVGVAAAMVLVGCGGEQAPSGTSAAASSTTPAGTAEPTSAPACVPFGSAEPQGTTARPAEQLGGIWGSSLRTGRHPCYDRVVLEFAGKGDLPGWSAVETTRPLAESETGRPIDPPLEGEAFIDVEFGAWYTGEPIGEPALSGPTRQRPAGYPALREVRILGGFEGVSELGIGLDQVRPFRVYWLADPYRLVVDVYTGWPGRG